MISDKEWEAFVNWCKRQWPMWSPDKKSIELYLKWNEDRLKNVKYGYKKGGVNEATHS